MNTRPDLRATSFDPYGEPLCEDRAYTTTAQGDRRARNTAIIVFWTLALMLTAGRVYYSDQSLGQTIAAAQAQIASFVTALR